MTRIDWIAKLRHLLQTVAFCLALSAVQYALSVDKPYDIHLVYSVCIGTCCWATIDFGRHFFPSAAETNWPAGFAGVALVLGGIVAGYVLGTLAADAWFGWSSWTHPKGRAELRSSVVITVLAGIAGSYYFYSANKSAYLTRKMREASKHASEARLKLLETQLEPHMLFNTLANLRVLIAIDAPRAQQMLDHMIDYLRATLSASRAATHPLQAEFDRLRDYLELMAMRMGPRLAYTLDLPDALAQLPVPALLLQPIVENAIQHGLEPKVEGGHITVRARREGDELLLEVEDTGVGTGTPHGAWAQGVGTEDMARHEAAGERAGPGHAAAAGRGFGLSQVRERLATLYGDAGSVKFMPPHAGGTRIDVRIPLSP